jgi:hypothetical protein
MWKAMAIKHLLFQTIMNKLGIRQMFTRKDFNMSFRAQHINGLIYLHTYKDLIKNIIHYFSSNLIMHHKLKTIAFYFMFFPIDFLIILVCYTILSYNNAVKWKINKFKCGLPT